MRDLFIEQYMQSFSNAKRGYITQLVSKASGAKPGSAAATTRLLQSLLQSTNTLNDEPITTPYGFTEGDLIYAPIIQGYFRQVAGDSYSLLNGLQQISKLNDAHRVLFAEFLLKGLEASVNQLEERLEVSELLSQQTSDGFTGSFSIDFLNMGSFTSFVLSDLIFDNYTQSNVSPDNMIEVNGGVCGYLPKASSNQIVVSSVSLKSPESSISVLDYVYDGSSLSNLKDNDFGTFYAPMIMSQVKLTNGATQKIRLSLGSDYDVTSIVVDPVGKYPCYLTSITYDNLNTTNIIVDELAVMVDTSIVGSRISKRTIIDIEKIRATDVYLTFVQDTYSYITVNTDSGKTIRYNDQPNPNKYPEITQIFDIASETNATSVPYYKYEFGFAEIGVFNNIYKNMGYYISPENTLSNLLLLGVDRDFNTSIDVGVDGPGMFSVEHLVSLVVQPKDETPFGLRVPLMPVGSSTMIEKIRIDASGNGKLSFPIDDIDDITDVRINNGLLSQPNYTVQSFGSESNFRVINLGPNTFSAGDILTVTYVPLFIKYPERRYKFNENGFVEHDIAGNGSVGIDERFLIVFYQSENDVKIRHRLIMRSFDNSLLRLNSLRLLYSLQDQNKYRGI